MPVNKKKLKSVKYQVRTPRGVKSKGTTKEKADSQERLLNAVEHGWEPTGEKSKRGSVADRIHRSEHRMKHK